MAKCCEKVACLLHLVPQTPSEALAEQIFVSRIEVEDLDVQGLDQMTHEQLKIG